MWEIARITAEIVGVVAAVASPFLVAWVRQRVRREMAPEIERIRADYELLEKTLEDACDRVAALEWWQKQVAPSVNAIPDTNALLRSLEATNAQINTALRDLDKTMRGFGERLARAEERTKHRPTP